MTNPCKKCNEKPLSFIRHINNWSWIIHCKYCQNVVITTEQEFLEDLVGKNPDSLKSTYNMLFDYELKRFKKLAETKWNKNNPKEKRK